MARVAVALAAGLLLLSACTTQPRDPAGEAGAGGSSPAAGPAPSETAPSDSASSEPEPSTSGSAPPSEPSDRSEPPRTDPDVPGPPRFDQQAAMSDVRLLAGRIGPRLATAPAYRRAARLVQRRLDRLGYETRREAFPVPAGDSWGVPVEAGRSFNVVAEPEGFRPRRPHLVVGAHLDTVAVAPGAEDNASGVAAMLEVARLAARHGTRQPVVFIAFGAEEPRGPGDDMHHFGSQHHVAELGRARREAITAMLSLDRVGVGGTVPVCTGPLSPPRAQRALLRTAREVGIPAQACENTASDHWSFEKAGVVVARIGSVSYAAYHSADDLPGVVNPRQLARSGRLAWAWLR